MSYDDKVRYVYHFLSGKMSPEESEAFALWRSSDPSHELLYSDLFNIYEKAEIIAPFKFDHEKAFLKHKALLMDASTIESKVVPIAIEKSNSGRISPIFSFKYIAAAVFVLAISMVLLLNNNNAIINGATSQSTMLADGTKVWLDQGAELKILNIDEYVRKVELKGKAYFEVVSNKKAPFMIQSNDFGIKVLGTKFIANGNSNSVEVREGKVEVFNDTKKVVITSNQSAKVIDNADIVVSTKEFDASTLWFNENLSFNNTPFDVVINDLTAFYNVKFIIPTQRDWSKCTFTSGPLKTATVDEVMTILKLTYELDYVRQNDNSIKISRVKCK